MLEQKVPLFLKQISLQPSLNTVSYKSTQNKENHLKNMRYYITDNLGNIYNVLGYPFRREHGQVPLSCQFTSKQFISKVFLELCNSHSDKFFRLDTF